MGQFHFLISALDRRPHAILRAWRNADARDFNQVAFQVVQESLGQVPKLAAAPEREKNPAAVALGRLGGLKGGKARAATLTARKRSQLAAKAAKCRWRTKR